MYNYVHFAQLVWLEKKFYTLINSTSKYLGTTFPPPAPNMCNNVDKNKILMTKLELDECIIRYLK